MAKTRPSLNLQPQDFAWDDVDHDVDDYNYDDVNDD